MCDEFVSVDKTGTFASVPYMEMKVGGDIMDVSVCVFVTQFASCSQTGFLTTRSDSHGPKRQSVLMQSTLTIDRDKAMFCSQ